VFVNVRKAAVALLTIGAAAALAAGCGSNDSSGSGSGDLAKEQNLVVQIGKEAEVGVFDPAKSTYIDTFNRETALFGGLYRYDDSGTETEPDLAADSVEASDDGLTYTVKLRDDVKWSDGKPLTADDAVFAVQHALDPKTGSNYATFMLDIVGACEFNAGKDAKEACASHKPKAGTQPTDGKADSVGVTATDDHTVEYHLNRPVPWFDQLLTLQTFFPLRRDVVEKYGDDWVKPENIVVSGPFTLAEYAPKDKIVMKHNDNYYKADDVKLDQITFRMIGEPKTAYREFQKGDLDMALNRVGFAAADIDEVKAQDYYVHSPSNETQYLYMNTRNPELADPKVRQAIAIAIDRPSIAKNITKRGDKPMNTIIPSGLPGFDTISEGAQEFIGADQAPQVDKAKSLLEEAGWDDKKSLDMYFASDSTSAPDIAQEIQSDLGKIGVKLNLHPTGSDVLGAVGYGISPVDAKVDMIAQGWVADYLDAQDYYQLFTCDAIDGGLNSANYCSKDFDQLYGEALKTVDTDARYDLYKQLEAKLTGPDGDMPAAPLYQPTNDMLVQTYVKQDGKAYKLNTTGIVYWDDLSITEGKKS
jgi:oligopeptide transport system substrate-binding protein